MNGRPVFLAMLGSRGNCQRIGDKHYYQVSYIYSPCLPCKVSKQTVTPEIVENLLVHSGKLPPRVECLLLSIETPEITFKAEIQL